MGEEISGYIVIIEDASDNESELETYQESTLKIVMTCNVFKGDIGDNVPYPMFELSQSEDEVLIMESGMHVIHGNTHHPDSEMAFEHPNSIGWAQPENFNGGR